MSITMENIVSRNPDLLAVPMDGDLVMMSISEGHYFGINPVGVRIWEALENSQTVRQLCEIITNEFDVDKQTCESDVRNFIQKMLEAKVVTMA